MNIMRVAIMEAQFTKHTRGLLLKGECEKFILNYKLAVSSFSASISMYRSQKNNISKSNNSRLLSYGVLQDPQLIPSEIAASLAEKKIGFRLDNADLVFMPVRKSSYWYLVVGNFRDRRFEVICPFKETQIIQQDALTVVSNFKLQKGIQGCACKIHKS
ncbi:hypothetical protein SETIT_9G324000v2 [Setaria italica]|uniref:Ubiquitin-like protease family profile domain-containing protein n=2 Tax=Setaria TaxID=4554 RepID=A0A368SN84_SETIT|nr:hypothetical protein SETIT_9G324000v2 [Setaria italica]TKV94948.1 hypothetical protein SEVIR_9G329800v2 [Setaria viridis]